MSAWSKEGLFAVCGSFIGLSAITFSLRLYARKSQRGRFSMDDWTALFGVITYIAAASLGTRIAILGIASYSSLTPEGMKARAKTGIELSIAYDFMNLNTLACAKFSALFMYQRVFAVDRHSVFNRIILATVAVIGLWYISSAILSCLQCPGHFSAAYDGDFGKYCYLNPVWAKELAACDLILDVWVLILPIIPVIRLHTTTAKKLAIFGVFLLGFIGLGASITRVVFVFRAHGPSPAVLYVPLLESGISITVVSLPSLYYFWKSEAPEGVAVSLRSIRSLESRSLQESRSGDVEDGVERAGKKDHPEP